MSTALFLGKSSLEALLGNLPKLNKFFGNMMWANNYKDAYPEEVFW